MKRCLRCAGKGTIWTGSKRVKCQDCNGTGEQAE